MYLKKRTFRYKSSVFIYKRNLRAKLVQLLSRSKAALWIDGRRRANKVDALLRLGAQESVFRRDDNGKAGRMQKASISKHLLTTTADLFVVVS